MFLSKPNYGIPIVTTQLLLDISLRKQLIVKILISWTHNINNTD